MNLVDNYSCTVKQTNMCEVLNKSNKIKEYDTKKNSPPLILVKFFPLKSGA
jgi:hypothetical protein